MSSKKEQQKKNLNSVKVVEGSNCKQSVSAGCTNRRINGNEEYFLHYHLHSLCCAYIYSEVKTFLCIVIHTVYSKYSAKLIC